MKYTFSPFFSKEVKRKVNRALACIFCLWVNKIAFCCWWKVLVFLVALRFHFSLCSDSSFYFFWFVSVLKFCFLRICNWLLPERPGFLVSWGWESAGLDSRRAFSWAVWCCRPSVEPSAAGPEGLMWVWGTHGGHWCAAMAEKGNVNVWGQENSIPQGWFCALW